MTSRRAWVPLLFFLATLARADWQWSTAEDVAPPRPGVFHHLDTSGRQALVATRNRVALVWSDTGQARCYLALKQDNQPFQMYGFGTGECFEPALALLDEQRFLIAWEDSTGIHASLADAEGVYPATTLAASGGQVVIRSHPELGIHAVWSGFESRWRRLLHASLTAKGHTLGVIQVQPVDPTPAVDDQMYPALADTPDGLSLLWEDRRLGHTVIYSSQLRDDKKWRPPQRVSHNRTGKINGTLGRGTGAMRPALARFGSRLMAVWLDKRDFLSGYDVYGSFSEDQGQSFGADLKVQDIFGDAIAQWHATVAGNPQGGLVVAWDDDRDGTADIWLTSPNNGGFAENMAPPPASGPLQQSNPALAMDTAGHLHLVWIEATEAGTRLRYARGRPK